MSGTNSQENRLAGMAEGDNVYLGAAAETGSEPLIELYGKLGLDWVWVDLEHKNASPLDGDAVARLARAAECGGVEPVVRLPDGDPATIRKVLDTGIRNVVVPRVETPADVRNAARACRFEYDDGPGDRGLAQGRSSGYGTAFLDDDPPYHRVEDEAVRMGVLLETESAVTRLDDILDVPGLDFVYPGPGDLGVSMGHTLEYDHPAVSEHVERIERTCRQRGVPMLGSYYSNFDGRDGTTAAVERGYRLVNLGNEFDFVADAVRTRQGWFEE